MNILICDDRQSEIDAFIKIMRRLKYDVSTKNFNKGSDVIAYIRTGAVADACFLDVVMPEMSGITLARQLRDEGYGGRIIFFTTSNGYASESYGVDAFFYLLKPLSEDNVRTSFEKLEKARNKDDNRGIMIKTSKVSRYLLFNDISHAEVIKNNVYFRYTDGGEVNVYATFASVAPQLLCDGRFVQCHRSYIVNLECIASISENEITMRGGKRIPNSKGYPDVDKRFAKWMIERGRG